MLVSFLGTEEIREVTPGRKPSVPDGEVDQVDAGHRVSPFWNVK
jgi:hypothetical protein